MKEQRPFLQMKAKAFSFDEAHRFAMATKSEFFIGKDAGQHFKRTYEPREVEVYPGIKSFDPRYLRFTGKLSDALYDKFPSVILPSGFYDKNAIATNFGELRTVAGYPMSPMTYTPVHNERLRDSLNLAKGFVSERHRKLFQKLIALRYAQHDGTAGKISKLSSSVFPIFTKDMQKKVGHLTNLANHADEVLGLAAKGDLKTLYDKFGALVAYEAVPRWQYDGVKIDTNGLRVTKPREVNDLEYALSEGERGSRFVADKSVFIDGSYVKEHFATRGRTASGLSNSVNAFSTAAFEGLRHYADSTYHMTYKHRGREEITNKFRKFPLVMGLDVTQYDQSFPEWLVDEWISLMPFTDNMKALVTLEMKAPMFFSAVDSISKPIWTGDPLDSSYFNQFKGLPSGIFATSAIGKDFMTWTVLCLFDDYYHDVLENMDKILKWEHPKYALSNMGDDSVLHISDQRFYDMLIMKNETSENGLSPYFIVDMELGIRFVGNVAYSDENDDIQVCGNLGTYFGNMLVPERGLGSAMREFGIYGLLERRNAYCDAPKFYEAEEVFLKLWYDTFGVNWNDGLQDRMKLPANLEGQVISQADLEVYLDSSKLHYKYEANEISPLVLDIVEKRISPEVTDKIMRATLTL